MADKTNRRKNEDVYWTNIAAESGEDDAYIPGLSAPGNKRPGRVHGNKMQEVKAKVQSRQPIVESARTSLDTYRPQSSRNSKKGKLKKPILNKQPDTQQSFPFQKMSASTREDSGMSTTFESFAEKSIHRLQQVSLKDLRPEDKQRVANLIKELARMGEEKEKAVQELHGERQQYEEQLMKMVTHQENILREREDVQEKLFQCQKLLTEYQNQLLNKQDRLNSSISEMREALEDKTSVTKVTKNVPKAAQKPTEVIEVCPFACDLSDVDERSITIVSYHRESTDRQDDCLPPQRQERQSRPVTKATRQQANQERDNKHSTNQQRLNNSQDESVSELLMNPADTIKRPFTSMIDKEIARERSRSRSLSQGSRVSSRSMSRSISPTGGRPKFAYPQTLNGIGPLREPLASSTQKSMEIPSQFENETLRSKISAIGPGQGQGHRKGQGQTVKDSSGAKSKVAFNDEDEFNDSTTVHSPNLKSASQMFTDPAYASYYKKLSPGGRKRELLKQRQALLDEQERLRKVLEKQEQQLSQRKYEYDKRVTLQKERMDFYKEGGKFPALKLDFETTSERGDKGIGSVEVDVDDGGDRDQDVLVSTEHSSHVEMYSPQPEATDDIQIVYSDRDIEVRSHVSMGTSPMTTPRRGNKVAIATSPIHSQDSDDIPKCVDVATSISYRTPTKDSSDQLQGNLPLGYNRQKININMSVPSPGEKTLNVLELVNSMEEEPISPGQPIRSLQYMNRPMGKQGRSKQPISGRDNQENRPIKTYTPNKYITHQKDEFSPSSRKVLHGKNLNTSDDEESIVENEILEDIFFL